MNSKIVMRRNLDEQPLSLKTIRPAMIGFDPFFDSLMSFADTSPLKDNYPPYDLIQYSPTQFSIEVALAGFSKKDISIYTDNGTLNISRIERTEEIKQDDTDIEYLHRGISKRHFNLRFKLAPDVIVQDAKMNDGILRINLELIIPEDKKPKKIEVS